jgi:cytochrome P450
MYSISLVARKVFSPVFALDDKYVVPKGTQIVIPSRYAGQYTPGWAAVRPSLVEKPLEELWPARFLTYKEGEKERYNDSGLTGSWTSFGGGSHHCPGRFWARDIGLVMLAAFVEVFEVQISDVEASKRLDPVWTEAALGTVRPTGKIPVRIKRRNT